ncbi:MAG: hypothetical protein FWF44_01265 [Defluviitaleaceae bacterium]|nr:hypothetical protein [Defluviitaleaceae bacterium]
MDNQSDTHNGDLTDLAETAASYLRKLSLGISALADQTRFTISESFGCGKETEEIIAGIEWAMWAMKILAEQKGESCGKDGIRAMESLRKAMDAAFIGDCVFFADMLDFEINPVIVKWLEMI